MSDRTFPPRKPGLIYLTEGGAETEILYKWGYDLPEFAMFPLLDNPEADRTIREMYRRYFEVAEKNGTGMVVLAHDYRASPDWSAKLGYSTEQLRDYQKRTIDFLIDLRDEYLDRVSDIYIGGCLGPRGDAYGTGGDITEDEAQAYHSVQLTTLKDVGADIGIAATFSSIAEAIGVIRAAERIGIPIGMSFNLGPNGRLRSGPKLAEAITETDAATNGTAAWFGTNCAHPIEFAPALAEPGPWRERLRYVRPNAAKTDKLALCKLGHLEDGDPPELGLEMVEALKAFPNVDIVGGCCGTDERHLDHIAVRVMEMRSAQSPAL